jgi:hypothetical protein
LALFFGRSPATVWAEPYNGLLDEIEVFNRGLSEGEIQSIYAAGRFGKCKVQVAIDIKPGSYPNSINLGSAGVIPVAILSSTTFDATQLDPMTIDLNGAGVKLVGKKGLPLCHVEDVNSDGLNDSICQVYTYDFIIEPGATNAVLKALTYDGIAIWGQDSVNIVP